MGINPPSYQDAVDANSTNVTSPSISYSPPPAYEDNFPTVQQTDATLLNKTQDLEKSDKKDEKEAHQEETIYVPPQSQRMDASGNSCPSCGGGPGPCFCVVIDVHNPLPTCTHCGSHDCNCHGCSGGGDCGEAGICVAIIACGGVLVFGTTMGAAIYTIKEIAQSLNESKCYGMMRSIVAAAGGVGGWFAAKELFSETIAQAASAYIAPSITKPIIEVWGATMGAAVTTFVSSAVCKAPVSHHHATLYGKKKGYIPVAANDYDAGNENNYSQRFLNK